MEPTREICRFLADIHRADKVFCGTHALNNNSNKNHNLTCAFNNKLMNTSSDVVKDITRMCGKKNIHTMPSKMFDVANTWGCKHLVDNWADSGLGVKKGEGCFSAHKHNTNNGNYTTKELCPMSCTAKHYRVDLNPLRVYDSNGNLTVKSEFNIISNKRR